MKRLVVNSISQLVVSQVNGNFTIRDKSMVTYIKQVIGLLPSFEKIAFAQFAHIENVHAAALSKLASSKDSNLLKVVPIENLVRLSISKRRRNHVD